MWVFRAIIFQYFMAACAAQDLENVVPVPTVHLKSQWSEIFPSEQVQLECNIDNSGNWTFTWYKGKEVLQTTDPNLFFSEDQSELTVTAASQSQSGKYCCKGLHKTGSLTTQDSNTVQLTIHGEKLKPVLSANIQNVFVGESVTFTCSIDVSSSWEYEWFLNNNPIQKSNMNLYTINSAEESHNAFYQCKARRGSVSVSTESNKVTLHVSDVPVPVVELQSQWSDVILNEVVLLSCRSVGTDWSFTWFRNGKQLEDADLNIKKDLQGAQLNISAVSKGLEGLYTCKARHNTRDVNSGHSQPLKITVHDIPKPTLSKNPVYTNMFVGESVNFTCQVLLSSGWTYKWYKNDQAIGKTGSTISIPLVSSDAGKYYCKASRGKGTETLSSDKMTQNVDNIPVPSVKLLSSWANVFVNEVVVLGCEAGSTEWTLSWLKNGRPISPDNTLKIHEQGANLQILSASSGHAGNYTCKAHQETRAVHSEQSAPFQLTVYDNTPKPTVTKDPMYNPMYVGEMVTYTCGVNVAFGWKFKWFKNDRETGFNESTVRMQVDKSNGGAYSCKAMRGGQTTTESSDKITMTVLEIPVASVKILTEWLDVFPSETVELGCGVSSAPSDWTYEWYKDNQRISGNTFDTDEATLTIRSASVAHKGQYKCRSILKSRLVLSSFSSELTLRVYDQGPQPKLVQDLDVSVLFSKERLFFQCLITVSSGWEYEWYKDNQLLIVSKNQYEVISSDTINSGSYTCRARRGKTHNFTTDLSQVKTVEIRKIPTPSVQRLTNWLDLFPTEIAMLSCGMENEPSNWFYKWHKNGKPINDVHSKQDGSILIINSSHSGEYSCVGQYKKRPVRSNYSLGIELKGYDNTPTVELVQDPKYSVFYTDDSVFFTCAVSLSSGWEYMWYRNNKLEAFGPNHTISHLQSSHSGNYKCQSKRGKDQTVFHTNYTHSVKIEVLDRPAAAVLLLTGWSEVFSTDSLLLKCVAKDTLDDWEFKWFKEGEEIVQALSETHKVTPQNDPDQSQYMCQGVRNGRPAYTTFSEPLKTNNLLLKRRVLLSISGCLVFGICAVFLGCIVLRVFRKPVVDQEKNEEIGLFLTREELTKHGPNPLAEYVTDEDIKELAKEPTEDAENETICSESTPLQITSKENEAAPSETISSSGNGEMVSFKP